MARRGLGSAYPVFGFLISAASILFLVLPPSSLSQFRRTLSRISGKPLKNPNGNSISLQ